MDRCAKQWDENSVHTDAAILLYTVMNNMTINYIYIASKKLLKSQIKLFRCTLLMIPCVVTGMYVKPEQFHELVTSFAITQEHS